MSRKFSSFGTTNLESRAREHPADIPEILEELQHRKSKAARQLADRLLQLKGRPFPPEPKQEDLLNVSISPGSQGDSGEKANRARPADWQTRFQFPPTPEQERAVDLFLSGRTMKISAFAGAGKTSTLKLLAATAPNERGLYLAFNKAIADEAKSTFSSRTDCRTTHSAALRDVRPRYAFSKDKWFNSLNARQLSSIWELKRYNAGPTALEPDMVAFLIIRAVRAFMQSGEPCLLASHVQLMGKALGIIPSAKVALTEYVFGHAQRLWSQMISQGSEMPLGHDGYLKLWSLIEPKLAYDFILLDEAQDTNPAVLSVMKQQDCQMIYVGDKHQQIYEWRGAENAMETIENAAEAHLTMSFRFGPELANEAGRILKALAETNVLLGNPALQTRVVPSGPSRTVLTRTNSMLFREVMDALGEGKLPHVVGGTKDMIALLRDVDRLQQGESGSHPDFFGFYNWREVEDFVAGPEGEHLLAFVNLVNQMGRGALWRAVLAAAPDEADADIILSTAHKAKGREWTSVRLADDFSSVKSESGRIPYSEARLFYVAMTRAQETLVVDPVLVTAFASNLAPDADIAKEKAVSHRAETVTASDPQVSIAKPPRTNIGTPGAMKLSPALSLPKSKQPRSPRRKRILGIF